jgi:hypothetical protein
MEKMPSVATIKQVSQEYDFPEWGLRGLVKRQAFPTIKCGNRTYIVREIFENFLKSGGELYAENQHNR